ncbi:hypothetical protein AKJ16_DCAP05495 [Drosera capensis]
MVTVLVLLGVDVTFFIPSNSECGISALLDSVSNGRFSSISVSQESTNSIGAFLLMDLAGGDFGFVDLSVM